MMDHALRAPLAPVVKRYQRLQRWRWLTVCWLAAAFAGLGLSLVQRQTGWHSPLTWPLLGIVAALAARQLWQRSQRIAPDLRWLAGQIEHRHPELHALLLTAVEQQARAGGALSYLQHRVLREAIEQARTNDWTDAIPTSRLAWAQAAHLVALAFFVMALLGLRVSETEPLPHRALPAGVSVSPGDVSLERGSSLVVLARFTGSVPASVDLVLGSTPEGTRRLPLMKSLADPVFGGSVPDVAQDFVYRVEYGDRRTGDFRVNVFEHPRLERADADLVYPAFTGLVPKRIADTRRLSAVEGTRLDLALQLNKPVTAARLIGKDKSVIELVTETNRATALLKGRRLTASQTFSLQLVDTEGRTNKVPAQFVFEVLKNRIPELKLASPRGDVRPSALEEISFDGTVWDDFGVSIYGLAYTLAGEETKVIELGRTVPAKEKRPFRFLLRLEDLAVQPDQLLAYYLWAEDIGPEGQVRRTLGDMYFAEIRAFEEIFRQGQGQPGQGQPPPPGENGEQSQPGNPTTQLAELQKQIINATWKLQRLADTNVTPQYVKDTEVVRDGQAQAFDRAGASSDRAPDARSRALWTAVTQAMGEALKHLTQATNAPASLPSAQTAEQAAYQALLKLQTREYEVARSRRQDRNRNPSEAQQRSQRQLDQLDLTEEEERYETQSQAQAPQSLERREQLQVLNRLQELARRQQDVNERLKELQTALQEAQTEPEREAIRRQLKRLREQEQQMLADVDELRQRMERPENQSRMAEQRQQLDQARSDLQRAAEATEREAVSQALAAGTRAERQLQQLRDELRQQSSSQFAEDMRQMRGQARELSRQQEAVARNLDALTNTQRRALSDSPEREALVQQLAQQKQRLTNLIDQASQVSEQAETAEPLVSKQLYDTVRKFNQDEANVLHQSQDELIRQRLMTQSLYDRLSRAADTERARSLELTAEMLRQGYLPQADRAEQQAHTGIDQFRQGVERAAQRVVGDDTEALRLAQQELEQLANQLNQEIARAETNTPAGQAPQAASKPNRSGQSGTPTNSSEQTQAGAAAEGDRPGNSSDRSDRSNPSAPPPPNRQGGFRDELDRWLNGGSSGTATGPIAGDDFGHWSDRLREVEEMLDFPELRNEVATVRERARVMRHDFNRNQKKPDWAEVRLKVAQPLVEVRQRIAEELARRESKESLVPIDRDPVPTRFSELVRRYYEALGKEKTANSGDAGGLQR